MAENLLNVCQYCRCGLENGKTLVGKDVDRILSHFKEKGLKEGSHILDVRCGSGLFSIELARRGYRVTALSFIPLLFQRAKQNIEEAGVDVNLMDASEGLDLKFPIFDAFIRIYKPCFSFINEKYNHYSTFSENFEKILSHSKQNALFFQTYLNAAKILRSVSQADVDNGNFDPLQLVQKVTLRAEDGAKAEGEICSFAASELLSVFEDAGCEIHGVWSSPADHWELRDFKLDDDLIVILGDTGH